jgi:hypothetical protein
MTLPEGGNHYIIMEYLLRASGEIATDRGKMHDKRSRACDDAQACHPLLSAGVVFLPRQRGRTLVGGWYR